MYCQECGAFNGNISFTGDGIPMCPVPGCGAKRWSTTTPQHVVVEPLAPLAVAEPEPFGPVDRVILIYLGIDPE